MNKLKVKSLLGYTVGVVFGMLLGVAIVYWLAYGVDSDHYARQHAMQYDASSLCSQIRPYVAKAHSAGHKVSSIQELRVVLSDQDEKELCLLFDYHWSDRREIQKVAMGDVVWEYSSNEVYEFRVYYDAGTVVIRKERGLPESPKFVPN